MHLARCQLPFSSRRRLDMSKWVGRGLSARRSVAASTPATASIRLHISMFGFNNQRFRATGRRKWPANTRSRWTATGDRGGEVQVVRQCRSVELSSGHVRHRPISSRQGLLPAASLRVWSLMASQAFLVSRTSFVACVWTQGTEQVEAGARVETTEDACRNLSRSRRGVKHRKTHTEDTEQQSGVETQTADRQRNCNFGQLYESVLCPGILASPPLPAFAPTHPMQPTAPSSNAEPRYIP